MVDLTDSVRESVRSTHRVQYRTDLAATLSIRTDLSAEQQQQADVGTSSRIRADVATISRARTDLMVRDKVVFYRIKSRTLHVLN